MIRGEKQVPRRSQNSRGVLALSEFVIPDNFSSPVVESAKRRVYIKVAIAPAPAFDLALNGAIENADDPPGHHVEQSGLRIEARRHPVCRAVGTRLDKRAVWRRRCFGLRDRASLLIDAARPRLIDEFAR